MAPDPSYEQLRRGTHEPVTPVGEARRETRRQARGDDARVKCFVRAHIESAGEHDLVQPPGLERRDSRGYGGRPRLLARHLRIHAGPHGRCCRRRPSPQLRHLHRARWGDEAEPRTTLATTEHHLRYDDDGAAGCGVESEADNGDRAASRHADVIAHGHGYEQTLDLVGDRLRVESRARHQAGGLTPADDAVTATEEREGPSGGQPREEIARVVDLDAPRHQARWCGQIGGDAHASMVPCPLSTAARKAASLLRARSPKACWKVTIRARSVSSPVARMRTASSPALRAPATDTVATGTPAGIWTIDSSESSPSRCFNGTGTPMTGSGVTDASMPGRCAAPPAPAINTRSPRSAAVAP